VTRSSRAAASLALALASTWCAGCDGALDSGPARPHGISSRPPAEVLEPAPATIHRLTRLEYESTLRDLLPSGIALPTELPEDTTLNGFTRLGASTLAIPPRDVEQYEAAAYHVLEQVLADDARRSEFFGCDLEASGSTCLREFIARFGARALRRPLESDEIEALATLATETGARGGPWRGAMFAASAILQSPHFLFRVEIGEPDPADASRLRFTSWEMASRLSYLLWSTTPDAELLRAAAAGELVEDAGLRAQIERMSVDPRARVAVARFFYEVMSLDRLASTAKDPDLFPMFTETLRSSMREEIEAMFADVYDRDADVREIFSTDAAFVDAELAALYGVPEPPAGERRLVRIPASEERGGVLGRAGILAMWAHATLNSPTLRGKFLRINVLCGDVPPPPEGVTTDIPPPVGAETLRQRLERHRTDPVCAGCHSLMDPMGFTFERFDPIGRRRELDQDLPIDATGEVEGIAVDGAGELGDVLAASPEVGACIARRFYRWSAMHWESGGEEVELQRIEDAFAASGYRMRELIEIVVMSPAFRTASPASE
jgi:hypothetical protein